MTASLKLVPLLEAVASTPPLCPWSVSVIKSLGYVLLWDSRDDADAAIMEAVARQEGLIVRTGKLTRRKVAVLGVLLARSAGSDESLETIAGLLKLRYAIATACKPA